MRITKVKLKDCKVFISWQAENKNNKTDEYSLESSDNPTPEFKKAVDGLAESVVGICELAKEDVARIKVSGISCSWTQIDKDTFAMGCTITAAKTLLHSNCPLNLVTPHKFDIFPSGEDKGDEKQLLPSDCVSAICSVLVCAQKYIEGEREQTDLFAGDVKAALVKTAAA